MLAIGRRDQRSVRFEAILPVVCSEGLLIDLSYNTRQPCGWGQRTVTSIYSTAPTTSASKRIRTSLCTVHRSLPFCKCINSFSFANDAQSTHR